MQLNYTLETKTKTLRTDSLSKTNAGMVNKFIERGAHFFYISGQFGADFREKFIKEARKGF